MLSNVSTAEKKMTIAHVVLGILSLFAAAQIKINIGPVPITLQTLVLVAICLYYRPKLAHYTIAGYITIGLLGLPIFTNFNSGIPYALGGTAGYLLGFWVASLIIPNLLEKYGRSTKQIFISCIIAQAIIYVPGVLWLSHLIGYDKAIYSGFLVFIPSGIIKVLLLVATSRFITAK